MNRKQIDKALKTIKRFEDVGGRAALDKIKTIENSSVDINNIQKQSRILTEHKIEPFNKQINTKQLAIIVQALRQPIPNRVDSDNSEH